MYEYCALVTCFPACCLIIAIIFYIHPANTHLHFVKQGETEDSPAMVVANCVELFIRDGIVFVIYRDGADIGMEIKREMHQAFLEITGGMKMPFLYTNRGSFWISKDAREYARKIEPQQPFLAVAYVAPNLAIRLMADFYGKFYKPEVPYKVFGNEDDALEWLKTYSSE